MAANFRWHETNAFARRSSLRVLKMWALAADAFDDHTVDSPVRIGGPIDQRLGAFDCRHFCAPGRTLLAAVGALAAFMANTSRLSANAQKR